MMEHSLGKNYSRFVNVLIFIFPIVIISLKVAGDIVLFILAMMGIFIAISQKLSPFIIEEIKVFSYLTIGYFTAVCLSVLFSGQAAELAHYIPRDFHFLFAPFIALAFFKAEININYLIVGTKVALLAIGIIAINQTIFGDVRASALLNPAVFGNLAVVLFFIVLTFLNHESIKSKIISISLLFFSLLAIVGSGTRGAWLSFLLLLGVYICFFYKHKTSIKARLKISLFLVIILCVIGSNQFVQDRVNQAYVEISKVFSGDKDTTSIGLRVGMYKAAIENIDNVPFFGHGYRTSNIVLFKNDSSNQGKISVGFNHLHNAYLTNYFNGGVALLGALLLLLFIPLSIFLKANSQNQANPVIISGFFLILGYASFGMVNILLGDTYMNGFFVFFLAIFLLLTNKSIKEEP